MNALLKPPIAEQNHPAQLHPKFIAGETSGTYRVEGDVTDAQLLHLAKLLARRKRSEEKSDCVDIRQIAALLDRCLQL